MIVLRCVNDDGIVADLDVFEGDDLRLDISAIESGQIGSVFGVSSQQLSLPPTKTNNDFFGNTYNIGSSPTVQFIKTVDCQVLQNGQEVFTGKLYLENVITDNRGDTIYNVVVVNETVDFKFLVQNLSFADLDFSSLDHLYTYGNITSSWDRSLLSGSIFYPLVNYGFDEENPLDTQIKGGGEARTFTNYNSPIRVDDFKPAIRVRECLDAIFDKVNYSYTSSLFTSGSYTDDIYMLATKDNYKGISDVNPISQSFRAYTTSSQDYPAPTIAGQVYFPAETYDNAGQYSNPTFTAGANGTYQFEINLVYSIIGYSAVGDERFVDVKIYKNGSPIDTYNFDLTGVVQGQMNLATQYYALSTSDTIDVRVSFTKSGVGAEILRIISSNNCRFKLISGPQSILGGTINVAENFSEIGVLDFLQGLIEKFNLVIEPDPSERNVLRIETFNDWVDQGQVVNWDSKVDYNEKWSITHPLQSQEKDILFTDVEDNDALTQYHKRTFNKIYGEYQYKSESDLAEGTKTIGKFFSPLPIKGVDGSPQTIVPILAEKSPTEPYKRYAFKPRLIYHNGRKDALGLVATNSGGALVQNQYYFQDENAITHTETNYGLGHHLEAVPSVYESTRDLHFGNLYSPGHWSYHQPQFNAKAKKTAFYEYWAFYINELYDIDSRLVTLNVFLQPSEIPTISLNDKIFIRGHYYRINKINGANITKDDSVVVELIKTLPRQLYYPRRRITELDSTPIDITLDDSAFSEDGFAGYVNYESGLVYTGSAIQPAADRDGLSVYQSNVVWNTQKPTTSKFTAQTNLGLNRVDESADIVDVRGDNNVIANNVSTARVEGSNNLVRNNSKFVQITGTSNEIGSRVENSSIYASNTSSIDDSSLSTIIGGDDTHISASNQSVVVGQNISILRGNNNIILGNVDFNTKNVIDLNNVTAMNLNRDLESIENLNGDDYNGIGYVGTHKTIGGIYRDYYQITGSAGGSIDLGGTPYQNAHYIKLCWSGSTGTFTLNLPSTDDTIPLQPGGNGYKRELRFFSDGTLQNNQTIFRLQPSGSDVIDGQIYDETTNRPYDGITIFGTPGAWYVVQRKSV